MANQPAPVSDRYRWVALTNTTAATFMSTLNGSIVIIALPAIFRGIGLDPLAPGSIFYLLWMIMGYRLVQAVLVVTLGRLGDMYGRVKIYNAGFVVFTIASILLSFDPYRAGAGAIWLIGWRVLQAAGGSMLMANSAAILTDAWPAAKRGFALGTNQIASLSGQFVGLVAGGLLAAIDWRLVFWVNVPVGVFGTLWAYLRLKEMGERHPARMDWWGNVTFALGLGAVLVGVTVGIQPYHGQAMGWTSPEVIGLLGGGVALLVVFGVIERSIAEPMFQLSLFRIRAFTAGSIAGLVMAIARGGQQFMLIIWLQGIWLPLHGYDFSQTPLWAGIFLLPLTAGFLASGPVAGILSDRFGSRGIATAGALVSAASFIGLILLPVSFSYWAFALIIAINGIGSGMFGAPNSSSIMGSVPARLPRRGLGHALHLPELRHGAVDRRVLLADDRRAGRELAQDADQRPGAARRPARRGPPDRLPAPGVVAVRHRAGRQSRAAPAGAGPRAVLPPGREPAGAHRAGILPRSSSRGRSTRAWSWCSSRPPRCRRWPPSRPCCAAAARSRRTRAPADGRGARRGHDGARRRHEGLVLIAPPGRGRAPPGLRGSGRRGSPRSAATAISASAGAGSATGTEGIAGSSPADS